MKCRKQNNSASRNVVLHMKLNVHLGDLNNCILLLLHSSKGFPGSSVGKESACNAGDSVSIPGLGRSLEKGKATHSSVLAWRIPKGPQGVRHD